jgi:hypothetical protein
MGTAEEAVEYLMTVAAFPAFDDGTPSRYELIDGVMVAGSLPNTSHAQIAENVGLALDHTFRRHAATVGPSLVPLWPRGPALAWARRRRDLRAPEGGLHPLTVADRESAIALDRQDDRTIKLHFYKTLSSLGASPYNDPIPLLKETSPD